MNKLDIYYAHPKSHYNLDIERITIGYIFKKFHSNKYDINITNPNQKWIYSIYLKRKESGDPDPFNFFREIAAAHDMTIGVTYNDHVIGAGVAKECISALNNKKEVYLFFYDEKKFKKIKKIKSLNKFTILSIEETRKRNKEEVL